MAVDSAAEFKLSSLTLYSHDLASARRAVNRLFELLDGDTTGSGALSQAIVTSLISFAQDSEARIPPAARTQLVSDILTGLFLRIERPLFRQWSAYGSIRRTLQSETRRGYARNIHLMNGRDVCMPISFLHADGGKVGGGDLSQLDAQYSSFQNAEFSGVTAVGTLFAAATFSAAILEGDFEGADFTDAIMCGSRLCGNFRNCIFHGSDLRKSDLSGSDLVGADFSDCDVSGVSFRHCRVSTDFLSGVGILEGVTLPNGRRSDRFTPQQLSEMWPGLGC